jgi:hypothetical protein
MHPFRKKIGVNLFPGIGEKKRSILQGPWNGSSTWHCLQNSIWINHLQGQSGHVNYFQFFTLYKMAYLEVKFRF